MGSNESHTPTRKQYKFFRRKHRLGPWIKEIVAVGIMVMLFAISVNGAPLAIPDRGVIVVIAGTATGSALTVEDTYTESATGSAISAVPIFGTVAEERTESTTGSALSEQITVTEPTTVTEPATVAAATVIEPAAFTVRIPKKISNSGRSNQMTYMIKVSGKIGAEKCLYVMPNSGSVVLSCAGKPDVEATISQYIQCIDGAELENTDYIYINGSVLASDEISAGSWQGTIIFNIWTEDK